ncbi:MAG: hypothetical protein ACTHOH_10850 [Lysobacteraceae bacterium]
MTPLRLDPRDLVDRIADSAIPPGVIDVPPLDGKPKEEKHSLVAPLDGHRPA